MREVGMWALLTLASIYDISRKKIPVLLLTLGAIGGILLLLLQKVEMAEWALCMLPGLGILFAGFITKQKIGYGDGALILALGLMEGGRRCTMGLLLALFLSSLVGITLLILKRANLKTQIPFAPFLLLAHVLLKVGEMV